MYIAETKKSKLLTGSKLYALEWNTRGMDLIWCKDCFININKPDRYQLFVVHCVLTPLCQLHLIISALDV